MLTIYYEIHITLEPTYEGTAEAAIVRKASELHRFKVAELLMQRRKEDTPERSKYDTFMTGHRPSMEESIKDTISIVNWLHDHGIKVWRYKIEDVKVDSRTDDIFMLLDPK